MIKKRMVWVFVVTFALLIGCGNKNENKDNSIDNKNNSSITEASKKSDDTKNDELVQENDIESSEDEIKESDEVEENNNKIEESNDLKVESKENDNLNSGTGEEVIEDTEGPVGEENVVNPNPGIVKDFIANGVSTDQIIMSWSSVQGALSYNIYSSSGENGTYNKIAEVESTSYKYVNLPEKTSYWFKVAAVNNGGEGELSTAITASTKKKVINNIGNSSGNISNNGYVAIQGDWIYYSNALDNPNSQEYCKFYKVRTDGTDKTLLSEKPARFINVVGDWIYYSDVINGSFLTKMKTDGTNKTILSDDLSQFINVRGEWIYYSNSSDGGSIYKIKTDGTEKTKLNEELSQYLTVEGDYIYYINKELEDGRAYKMKIDGTAKIRITEDKPYEMVVSDGVVYYTKIVPDFSPGRNKLYKIKADGTEITLMDELECSRVNIAGDWVYYIGRNREKDTISVYKIKKDGSNKITVTTFGSVDEINIVSDWIYYQNWEDSGRIYKMKIDGSQVQLVQ